MSQDPLSTEAFIAALRDEGARRYHDHHDFHRRMHAGELSRSLGAPGSIAGVAA